MDAAGDVPQIPRENIKTSFLDVFNKLTLDKEKLRVKGGVALVKHLARNSPGEKDLNYALTRLIRGLGASNNEIKRRYFSVLVALLSCKPEISTQQVLEILEKELSLSASNSKSENADAAFGQILTCGALIRARPVEEKKELVETILSAGKKRSYLYLAALTFILELCNSVEEDEFKKVIWPVVKPEDHTMDSIYLLLSLKRKYPGFKKLGGIVSEDSLSSLASVLTNIPGLSSANHPVYEMVAEELAKTGLAVSFLGEVDLSAFNYNRLLVTTKILCGVVASLSGGAVLPDLLTESFMAQAVRHLKTCQRKDDVLQTTLCGLFEAIGKAQLDSNEMRLTVLKHFLFHPMISALDKTARSLIAGLNEGGVKALAELCRGVLHDGARTNHNKVFAAKLLAKLLGHPQTQTQKELPWKTEQLKFLMEMALLKNHASVELSGLLRGTFFQALDLKLARLEDLRVILSGLVHHLESFLQAPDDFRRPLNPVALETWQKTTALIYKLEKKNKLKHVTLVFLVLFLHMSLQLFNEVKLANDSLGELVLCYEKIKSSGGESDVPWIEVVVDLFLSLLSQNSHLLRSLIRNVFPHLCKYMNETALHQILFVLDPLKEDNPLSPQSENEEDLEEDDESGESSSDTDEDEENETVNDKLRMALQAALNPRRDDEESLDLDEMSDGEGKRLDEALADAFKQFKPNLGRNTKKERKDKEVLTHFRIRVLDLLDVYLDSGPAMLLCFEAIPPLLHLLEFSARDHLQDPLMQKVNSALQKLCGTKIFGSVDDVNAANLCALLKDLVGRDAASGVDNAVSECCAFMVRCALYLELPVEEINEIMLSQFPNQSALSLLLIKKVLQSTWPGNMALVARLVGLAFEDETRTFKRVRFLELLRAFYANHRGLSKNAEVFASDLKECERKFVENAVVELNAVGGAKQTYVRSLFVVLGEIKRSSRGEEEEEAPWWTELADCLRKCGSGLAVSQDAKCAFRALCKSLGVKEVVKAGKRKLVENGVDESASEKRPKSKAKSLKGKRNKKERQRLRMSAMSEGLTAFNFGDAIVGNDSEWGN